MRSLIVARQANPTKGHCPALPFQLCKSDDGISGDLMIVVSPRHLALAQTKEATLTFERNHHPMPSQSCYGTAFASVANEELFDIRRWRLMASLAPGLKQTPRGSSLTNTTALLRTGDEALPLVSVIIPYFNHAEYLAETVESARQQRYPHLEIIVVDDGSTVPASSILEASENVVLLRTENRGVSSARNIGYRNSRGEYLIFLDADDPLMPGAVEAHLNAFSANPDAGMTFGPARIIDGAGNEIRPPKICRPRKNYFAMLLESNPIACPSSTMIRRQAFVAAGFFDETFRNAEDYHLYLRLARQRPVIQHNACVVSYRKHIGGKSNNTDRMTAAVMAILDQFENDPLLSRSERRTLLRGRKRWMHAFRPKKTLGYRLEGLYYHFRAMLTVPVRYYFRPR